MGCRTHLLIIDSHKSHVYNYPFLQYMLSNKIQVMAKLIAPTSFSPWTMFLLLVSSGHGRNIWITGISSTWVHCSTKPIFLQYLIEHFTLQCQSQTSGLGSKIQVFILSIMRLSLPQKWHPAMSQMCSEMKPVRKC